MIPTRASAAAAAGWGALPDVPPPAAKEEDGELAELSISDRRTLYLANIFIGNTARFLNSFASLCQDKLVQVHREIMNAPVQRIDEILSMSYLVDEFMGVELPPNDDDSWMYDGEEELNSAILERQKEMEVYESEKKQRKQKKGIDNASSSVSDDFNLQDITETMQAFVQKLSSFEGADVPESRNSKSVELDTDEFMKAMQSMLGEASCKDVGSAARLEGHTSSSDMEFDDSEDDDDEVEEQEDENSEDGFMQFYSDALNEELTATTLRKSFLHARKQANNINAGPSNTARSNTADDNNDEFTAVDVDFNLVKSFLDSFSSQQGLPGPASNLLGLMGVKVPPPDAKDT